MRISDVSSDVGSSDLSPQKPNSSLMACWASVAVGSRGKGESFKASSPGGGVDWGVPIVAEGPCGSGASTGSGQASAARFGRPEEHTSDLQSRMRTAQAVRSLQERHETTNLRESD